MKKLYFLLIVLISSTNYSQNAGDIIITEILQNPTGTDANGEYFELYNTTSSTININGWTIKDNGTESHIIDNGGPLEILAGGYVSLGRNGDTTINGNITHDYIYSNFALGNGDDEIILEAPNATIIDQVYYDESGSNAFPDPNGPSMQLDINSYNATDNDTGSNWCASSDNYGTPGAMNVVCAPVCEASLGSQVVECDAKTTGEDTYSVTLAFSGAGTTTFVVTSTAGDVGGDNPTNETSGDIIITNIPEGTDVTITMDDTSAGGLCTLTREVTSPICEPTGTVDIEIRGVMDFTVPSGSSDGKAHHLVVTADNVQLSDYGLGSANNGGGTDGEEFSLPAGIANNGDNILIVRNEDAIEAYFTSAGYALFDLVIVDTGGDVVNGNGNDAIELFKNGTVVETFGDINDSDANNWNYEDSWAYKTTSGAVWPAGWSYGTVNCTDGTTTIFESSCVYPFLESLSTENNSLELVGLFPNPINKEKGYMNVLTDSKEDLKVIIFDVLGKKLNSQTVSNNQIDISSLKSGIYLVKISQTNKQITRRIIIE